MPKAKVAVTNLLLLLALLLLACPVERVDDGMGDARTNTAAPSQPIVPDVPESSADADGEAEEVEESSEVTATDEDAEAATEDAELSERSSEDESSLAARKNPTPPEGKLWSFSELGAFQNKIVEVIVASHRGEFTIEVYPEIAPNAAAGFLRAVRKGYYDGTYFHRVINDPDPFVAQAGSPVTGEALNEPGLDPESWPKDAQEKQELADELGGIKDDANMAHHEVGTLSLGKEYDQSTGKYVADSSAVQFFINLAYNEHLVRDFAVFGKVSSGMDVVVTITQDDKIDRVYIVE